MLPQPRPPPLKPPSMPPSPPPRPLPTRLPSPSRPASPPLRRPTSHPLASRRQHWPRTGPRLPNRHLLLSSLRRRPLRRPRRQLRPHRPRAPRSPPTPPRCVRATVSPPRRCRWAPTSTRSPGVNPQRSKDCPWASPWGCSTGTRWWPALPVPVRPARSSSWPRACPARACRCSSPTSREI